MLVIDKDMLTSVIYNVEDNADIIFDISDKVVKDYLEDLDNLMNDIKENVVDIDDPATNIIEKSYIRLANMLYYVSAKVEDIGFYDDIAPRLLKKLIIERIFKIKIKVYQIKKRDQLLQKTNRLQMKPLNMKM